MSKERSALKCLMSSHKGYDCNYESAVFTHIYGNLCSSIYTKIGAWEGPNGCVGSQYDRFWTGKIGRQKLKYLSKTQISVFYCFKLL